MNQIICKNIYSTNDEIERCREFNNIWQKIVNLIIKSKNY